MLRTLAPSGSPIKLSELAAWLLTLARGQDKSEELLEAFRNTFGVKHCLLFSTGRAAMCFLFRCLHKYCDNSQRNEVVIPGYTCYSVASSAVMAGLKIRVCDIDPVTLSYDLEQLESVDFSRVLCVVTANLYGLPDDLQEIERITNGNNVYLVDDAAQSLGATVTGKPSGTFGIAGLYSLDKGKNITSIQGGIIVTNDNALAELMLSEFHALGENSRSDNVREYFKALVYFFFLHPALYWIPARLPFLSLGETRYEEDYPIHKYPSPLSPIALAQLKRYMAITTQRTQVARWYQESLPEHPDLLPVQPGTNTQPAWLRFPLRIIERSARNKFLVLNRAMGCTGSYPKSIAEIPEIREQLVIQNLKCDASKTIASEIVTLPTHTFVSRKDVSAICHSLQRIVTG
ncbi:DegT/DnrJ/EryC1/StrS family aminotransferase [Crocinitomicaceae bacterium]|nr:DegT/DnrJ/EryC1/StrS family aminotransferase [Crocinitomicaceae bacterium]